MSADSTAQFSDSQSGTRFDLFAASVVARCIQGMTLVCLIFLDLKLSGTGQPAVLHTALLLSSLSLGMAVGAAVDRLIASRFGKNEAATFGLVAVSLGLVLLRVSVAQLIGPPQAWFVLATFTLAGIGLNVNDNSLSAISRNAVASRIRWKSMRIYEVAFPLGMLIATSGLMFVGDAFTMGVHFAGLVTALIFLVLRPQVEHVTPVPLCRTQPPRETVETSPPQKVQAEGCEETDCCGGSAASFKPITFRHGVALAAIGSYTLIAGISQTMVLALGEMTSAVALASGLVVGVWLLFSTAPRIGYAVATLPFLTVAIICSSLCIVASGASLAFNAASFLVGVAYGGLFCGLGAVITELFADCSSDPIRRRVHVMGLFATAILFLLVRLSHYYSGWAYTGAVFDGAVLLCGLWAFSRIPTPIMSSLGKEEVSSDDPELRDVMAALQK